MERRINKMIFFNEELIKYIVLKDYTYVFMFRLVINDDIYIPPMVEIPISQKDIPSLQQVGDRNLIISTKKEWKKSSLPGSTIISTTLDDNFDIISYTNVITTVDIALNLVEDDDIIKIYNSNALYETLQQILNLVLYKINATSCGKQWYNLPLSSCGPQRGGVYKIQKNPDYSLILHHGLASCSYRSDDLFFSSYSSSVLDEKVFIWKYYYNRALAAFNGANLLDFFINGTLACESFFYYLLRQNSLQAEFEEYVIAQNLNSNIPAGGFTVIKFLRSKSIITKPEERLFKKVQGKLSAYRNNIIHGKIENPNELSYDGAYSACKSLQSMFNDIEAKECHSIKRFKVTNFSLVNQLKEKIEQTVIESDGFSKISDFSELKNDINTLIGYNLDLPTCHYYLGEIYYIEKNYEKAIFHLNRCISYNNDIGYAAFRLAVIYNIEQKYGDEKEMVVKAISAISNKAEITPKAILYLEKLHLRAFLFGLYDDCFLALKTCFDATHDVRFAFLMYKIAEIIKDPNFIYWEAQNLLNQHDGESFTYFDYYALIEERKTLSF